HRQHRPLTGLPCWPLGAHTTRSVRPFPPAPVLRSSSASLSMRLKRNSWSLFCFLVVQNSRSPGMRIGIWNTQRVEMIWRSRSSGATKFCITHLVATSTRPAFPAITVRPINNDLMVSQSSAAHLPEEIRREVIKMKTITGRRNVLGSIALTVATGTIALTSAAKPATAATKFALTPVGATHLDALMKRLADAPRRRDFKTVPMILDHPEQWDHEALTEVLSY